MKWSLKDTIFTIVCSINVTLSVPFMIITAGIERNNESLERTAQYDTFGYYDKNIDLLNLKNPYDWLGGLGVCLILITVSILIYWCFDICWRYACEQKRQKESKKDS